MHCAGMASSLSGSLRVLHCPDTDAVESSCISLALSLFGSLVLHWHGAELVWKPSSVALAWH